MKTEVLDYQLPAELIAQTPAEYRSRSRLLVLDRAAAGITDTVFNGIEQFLRPGDCLVLNDTKVLPARFFARRDTGGKLEGLFLNIDESGQWAVMIKHAAKIQIGESFYLKDRSGSDYCRARLTEKFSDGSSRLQVQSNDAAETVLEDIGFAPLPPYIKRTDDADLAALDKLRYQTVYARKPGAVAAPTAGLHFTRRLIEQLKAQSITFAYITLHVGPGTFRPVKTENLEDHEIHKEWFELDSKNARLINSAKQKDRRVIAVGTTSVRTLETIAANGRIRQARGSTNLFIRPGYKFEIIDAMVTNFHLPKSTLLALVAAFAGLETIRSAYQHAIDLRYRFYSYGDAMLIV
jgi:S-adenosylmethionine:tRNA ribosyltransferase-isomerase